MMKNKLVLAFVGALMALNFGAIGGSQIDGANSNYVVIGAFAIQSNAKHFAENAKKLNFKADLDINPTRNLFYVYVLHTGDSAVANAQARKLRTQSRFNDTWVYRGLLGIDAKSGMDVNPVTEEKLVEVESKDTQAIPVIPQAEIESANTSTEESKPTVVQPILGTIEAGSKGFIFETNSSMGEPVDGEIEVIDAERNVKSASYESNKLVGLKPINKSGRLTLMCQVFGYRKAQTDVNYNLPASTPGAVVENGYTIIPFELIPLRKGDIAVMYNVLFFKDAAIMRPDSRYEINRLKDIMIENPNLKVKIHGHTNGNSAGKIIRMGDKKSFFSLTGGEEGFGSAKELSQSRAEVIRDFLVEEGVDVNRLVVKAWGGKRPIHNKKSSLAHENVRVEIEILED